LGQKNYSPLKTFLVYLNCMPEVVFNVEGKNIISSDISIDFNIANKLRTL